VHPPPPTRRQLTRWEPDLRALPPAGRRGGARILAGDFNATLDHAELRRILDAGYRDVAASVGAGWRATWPSTGRLPGVAIDHVLIPEHWRALRAEVLALPGSDHRAVLAEIAPPERPQR
jgi:endonuclease/exonuclease/phosphatase (EEP) superfamily protein YafD